MTLVSTNPHGGETLVTHRVHDAHEIDLRLTRAHDAQRAWRSVPRAARADHLRRIAVALRAHVDVLALYRTVAETLDEAARTAALGADYALFTSASSARFLHEAAGTLEGPRIVSIGPVTSEAIRALGREPDVEATEHTPDGMVAALLADARR